MRIHSLTSPPPPNLACALEEFEYSFLYPLGPKQKFRISHGREYLPFFRAMGEATLLVAEHAGDVLGTLVLVRRMVQTRTSAGMQESPAFYLCDLKVRSEWQRTPLLLRLIAAARKLIESSGVRRCYCVVMDGTRRLPTSYTGRLEIPPFEKLGEIMIIRATFTPEIDPDLGQLVSISEVDQLFQQIRSPGVAAAQGLSSERSRMSPRGLIDASRSACGVLEDTRRGKQLWLQSGEELLSAHLSRWAWTHAHSGAAILKQAVSISLKHGFPALFAALPNRCYPNLAQYLDSLQVQEAPATVFGIGFDPDQDWWIDTAEI